MGKFDSFLIHFGLQPELTTVGPSLERHVSQPMRRTFHTVVSAYPAPPTSVLLAYRKETRGKPELSLFLTGLSGSPAEISEALWDAADASNVW